MKFLAADLVTGTIATRTTGTAPAQTQETEQEKTRINKQQHQQLTTTIPTKATSAKYVGIYRESYHKQQDNKNSDRMLSRPIKDVGSTAAEIISSKATGCLLFV